MKLSDLVRRQHGMADTDDIGVRHCLLTKAETDQSQRLVSCVANTATVDLSDEVVLPEGAMRDGDGQISYFADARAIYLNHDYSSLPIGKMRNASIDSAGNWICNLFITNATAAARETFQLIQEGIINGVSIGFKSMDRGAPTQAEVQKYGPCWSVVRKWLWIELSITPQPCNPEAWITGIKSAPAESVVKEIQDRVKRGYVSAGTAKALGVAPVEPSPRRLVFL